jgi:O-methyltransferase
MNCITHSGVFIRLTNIKSILATPEDFIEDYAIKTKMLDQVVDASHWLSNYREYACDLYLVVLQQFVTATIFREKEMYVSTELSARDGVKARSTAVPMDKSINGAGYWSGFGMTMVGEGRLLSMRDLLKDIFYNKIEGAVAEMGVWRGGMSIYIRAVMRAYGEEARLLFVCDSFIGLPPSSYTDDMHMKWDEVPYLEVSDDIVKHNFVMMGIHDPNIIFAKGFFSSTMKAIADKYPGKFAILRLDGDMYESSADVLYHLYSRLSIGGYAVIDDWLHDGFSFPSKVACEHFLQVHGLSPEIIAIDSGAVYWKKTEEVQVQYWRYEQKRFTP